MAGQFQNFKSGNEQMISESRVGGVIELRRSVPLVSEPKATSAQIKEAVRLALLAPDHRRLTPWRFVLVEADEAFERMALSVGGSDSKLQDKWRKKFARAPQILIAILSPIDSPKDLLHTGEFTQFLPSQVLPIDGVQIGGVPKLIDLLV